MFLFPQHQSKLFHLQWNSCMMAVPQWQLPDLLLQLQKPRLCVLLLFCFHRMLPLWLMELHLLISSPPGAAIWRGRRWYCGVGSGGHPNGDGAGEDTRRRGLLVSTEARRWHSALSEQEVTGWFTNLSIRDRGQVERGRVKHHLLQNIWTEKNILNVLYIYSCFRTCETLFGWVISPSGLRNLRYRRSYMWVVNISHSSVLKVYLGLVRPGDGGRGESWPHSVWGVGATAATLSLCPAWTFKHCDETSVKEESPIGILQPLVSSSAPGIIVASATQPSCSLKDNSETNYNQITPFGWKPL